ncbi:MAG TPA: hypothetical protein VG603_14110 [Chitinophagales bacterium]|nr:hypothetical protein [Chitinophagales bacterium]
MKKYAFVLAVALIAILAGCKKDTDNAAAWVGTYTSTGTVTDSLNQVTISEVNSSTLQIQLQYKYNISGVSGVYTFATIQGAKLSTATSASVNESGTISGSAGTYQFTGGGALSGNSLTLTGQAVNTSNSSDIRYYVFTGSK